MKNIDIRYPADIGIADIDVYKTNKKKAFITSANYYVKVRVKSPYNSEFGFDWIDVDPSTGDIQKIQDISFSELKYFYKKPANINNPRDLGNIVEAGTDPSGVKDAIKENYKIIESGKKVDIPWILVKPNQSIELSLEINLTTTAPITSEAISIIGDEFYDFEILNGTKNGNKTEKNLTADKEVLTLKIKCLKEGPEKEYNILQESPGSVPFTVGGFKMLENKIQKIKFRVIALVSSDNSPATKAKDVFQKFVKADIVKYLNNNSLNQAGYEVEIDNQAMFDSLATASIDDYYYAFDKTDWTNKKYFGKKGTDDILAENQKDLGGPDKSNALDNIVYKEYLEKLKVKKLDYNGGIIILSEYPSSGKAGAYSRTSPLNHYKLFVYSTNLEHQSTYAHEIGHMLGLPHLFYLTDEKESYETDRARIIGNGLPESDSKYIPGILKSIKDTENSKSDFFIQEGLTAEKKTIVTAIDNFIKSEQKRYDDTKKLRDDVILRYKNFPDSYKVTPQYTKAEYIALCNKIMKDIPITINENKKAKEETNLKSIPGYYTLNAKGYFLKKDYIILLKQNYEYLKIVIKQVHDNYLMFEQYKTQNLMDYSTTRIRFLYNQIKIMRDDLKNYQDVEKLNTAPKAPPKKKK
ncbi:hypothetical protein ACQWU4_09280 [Chryseobacterium sp. MIQD13]|uniref:hypothetical protein n=1 Tax=Chryseobacterium sp. MIQD13 TaxID=3422310 RepID=UPI003D2A3B10